MAILQYSDPAVIKTISNIALNGARGDVTFTPKQRKRLKLSRHVIEKLIDRCVPVEKKRQLFIGGQTGSGFAAILPILKFLLPTVLSTVGGELQNK